MTQSTTLSSAHQQADNHGSFAKTKAAVLSEFSILIVLLFLNLICFRQTLNGYFLADDFVHIPYLANIFHGHPELLLRNFYTNWMQAQGTQFYRPFISLTLALDYAIWNTNAAGYHITNLLYQVASSYFLFLTVRRLFKHKNKLEAWSTAFCAGALFSVCPLHPEVVSWVIGRVDGVATTFLLASFWLYLKARDNQNHAIKVISLIAFVIALLSKEMAITLPPTLMFLHLLEAEGSFTGRIKTSFLKTMPFWLILAAYLCIRTLALGTISGGYAGSIGSNLSASIVKRFFLDGSFLHVLFPLNSLISGPTHRLVHILGYLYIVGVAIAFVKTLRFLVEDRFKQSMRRLTFALGWFFIAMIPTFQVWNLTPALSGSRFIYLGTAPLCLLLSLLVAPTTRLFSKTGRVNLWTLFTSFYFLALLLCYGCMTFENNIPWHEASRSLKAFKQSVERFLTEHPDSTKLALLNIPQRYKGAHMLYNSAMLSVLLCPPLSPINYNNRVITFEPATFGDEDLINVSRLEHVLQTEPEAKLMMWNEKEMRLQPLNLVSKSVGVNVPGSKPASATIPGSNYSCVNSPYKVGIISPVVNLPVLSADFVDLELKGNRVHKNAVASIYWNSPTSPQFDEEHSFVQPIPESNIVRFSVSEHKKWVKAEKIYQIKVQLPSDLEVKSMHFISGTNLIPSLVPMKSNKNSCGRKMFEDPGGVCRPGKEIGLFSYDASNIAGAASVALQISHPDSFFEHYTDTLRDSFLDKETAQVIQSYANISAQNSSLPSRILPGPGYYEMRVFALDKNGKPVGYASDPLILQFSSEDVQK